jgi:hypothetical protein
MLEIVSGSIDKSTYQACSCQKKKKKARKGSIAGGVAQVVECLSNNIFASIPQNIPFSSV